MSEFAFTPASKEQRKARIFLSGPSGSGKTYTALIWASVLGKRVGVIDTEHDSALDYADEFDFHHLSLNKPYTVPRYIAAIDAAASAGLDVLLIDSVSHAWAGSGGLLSIVDEYGKAHRGDSFSGWREATPQHLLLIEAMLSAPMHLIVTTRAKQDYQLQQNDRGKWEPVKLGLAPVQREGLEYEFAIAGEMSVDHVLTITKTRVHSLDGYTEVKPGRDVAETLVQWLGHGRAAEDVIEELFLAAQDAASVGDLQALRERVKGKGAARAEIVDPDTGEVSTLDEYVVRRGRALWERDREQRAAEPA
jgi:hypothetical protein